MPGGRPKSRFTGQCRRRYLEDPFYATMARALAISPERVLARAQKRAWAIVKLGGEHLERDVHQMRLDNPFMESHAWKYLARETLKRAARSQQNQPR